MKKHEVHEDPEFGDFQEFEGELTGYAMPAISTGKMGRPGGNYWWFFCCLKFSNLFF